MLAVLLYLLNVRVTALAGLVAGIFGWMSGYFADGSPAIVPIFSKAFRHNVVPCHQKHQKSEDEQPRESVKMPCIFESTHQAFSPYNPSHERPESAQV
jgi:hypothetical protein